MEKEISEQELMDSPEYRQQLLEAAQVFKSNWVRFGEFLTRVASDKLYTGWGYKNFEEYCKVEVKIKKNTAIKLTNAYFFVSQEDPEILQNVSKRGLPDLDVVNFLHKAKSDENCDDELYQELKESALDKGQSPTTLSRRLKEMTRPSDTDSKTIYLEQSISLTNRLKDKMSFLENVPTEIEDCLKEIQSFLNSKKSSQEQSEETS